MARDFSGPVSVFRDRRLPEAATPAGYAALIHAYDLAVPVPRVLCAIGTSDHRRGRMAPLYAASRPARHRVRNNMPGTAQFCPLVFKTAALDEFIAQDLKARAPS
jgi:hypothetical protein